MRQVILWRCQLTPLDFLDQKHQSLLSLPGVWWDELRMLLEYHQYHPFSPASQETPHPAIPTADTSQEYGLPTQQGTKHEALQRKNKKKKKKDDIGSISPVYSRWAFWLDCACCCRYQRECWLLNLVHFFFWVSWALYLGVLLHASLRKVRLCGYY